MNLTLWTNGKKYQLSLVEKQNNQIQIKLGDKIHQVSVEVLAEDELLLQVDGKIYDVIIHSNRTCYSVFVKGFCVEVKKESSSRILGRAGGGGKKRDVVTTMPGRIVNVLAKEGDLVEDGQPVIILEAMKMQNAIKAPQAGKVTRIKPRPGESVEAGSFLFSVE
ncbi:MAG: biotin/lipoyl-containing protein [Acidobacteriota bacterium]